MARKAETTTDLERALLDDARALLEAIYLYGNDPTPRHWCAIDDAATSLADTTYGTLGTPGPTSAPLRWDHEVVRGASPEWPSRDRDNRTSGDQK